MKTFPLSLLFMCLLFAFTSRSYAQPSKEQQAEMRKKYEKAYNAKDASAFKNLYTKDAKRTNTDGSINTGNDAIIAALAEDFKGQQGNPKLTITPDKPQKASDGTVTETGTWRLISKSVTNGAYDVKGHYADTLVKENGTWKIARSVVTMEQ